MLKSYAIDISYGVTIECFFGAPQCPILQLVAPLQILHLQIYRHPHFLVLRKGQAPIALAILSWGNYQFTQVASNLEVVEVNETEKIAMNAVNVTPKEKILRKKKNGCKKL